MADYVTKITLTQIHARKLFHNTGKKEKVDSTKTKLGWQVTEEKT